MRCHAWYFLSIPQSTSITVEEQAFHHQVLVDQDNEMMNSDLPHAIALYSKVESIYCILRKDTVPSGTVQCCTVKVIVPVQ